ncbi:phosphonate metabolism transcriptional regulator PhnF [Phenylobacterium sp.]|uniref:phosphonate metabolism transcriptional regulator PhnF n=2 Tax=Phenylobacterium sp. TaxID=1871053 RepID=UPI0027300259|nr:phosphonate metabolism transcriptional regulator PhnF [Phenylobacterium sp.]MDP1986823.1 phosphonate metabolism transcriptional regulator PhnF [Phenylobacterium sp.]
MSGAMPLWREIAQSLERQIRSRELTPGDKLPTEHELSRQFMVNRHTVRRALSDLQEKGIVESTQGRGSFVRRPSRPARLQKRPRFTEAVLRSGAEPTTQILKLEVRPAISAVAEALGVKIGAPVIFMERLRFVDGEPTALGLHHFSFERFPTFIEMYKARGTITQTLRDSGVPDYTRRRTAISARLPTPQEAEQLHVPRHVPLLIRRYLNVDGLGRPLEFGESRSTAEIEIVFQDPERD